MCGIFGGPNLVNNLLFGIKNLIHATTGFEFREKEREYTPC
jgi:hypothetical protein